MEKHVYFLVDGHEVINTKMMTLEEAYTAQAETEENFFAPNAPIWHGPFTVSGPHSKFPWLVIPAQ